MIEFINTGSIELNKVYMHPIWADVHLHPALNKLSLLYIYDIEEKRELILNIGNCDYHKSELADVSFNFGEVNVFDKKSLSHIINIPHMFEAGLYKYLQVNENLKEYPTSAHTFFQRKRVGYGQRVGWSGLNITHLHLHRGLQTTLVVSTTQHLIKRMVVEIDL